MRCPTCQQEGKRSTVRVTPRHPYYTITAPPNLGSERDEYWDEEGAWHSHNSAWHDQQYTCSGGHEWNIRWRSGCESCEFGGEQEITPLEPRKMVSMDQLRWDGVNFTLDDPAGAISVEVLPR